MMVCIMSVVAFFCWERKSCIFMAELAESGVEELGEVNLCRAFD